MCYGYKNIGRQSMEDLGLYLDKGFDLNFLVRNGDDIEHRYIYATDAESYAYVLNTYSSFNIAELDKNKDTKFDDICSEIPMYVKEIKDKKGVLSRVYSMDTSYSKLCLSDFE